MQKKPLLTIGLPVFNGDQFLEKRIQNILSQTFQDYELIISDNNSTDNTSKICADFKKKDERIQYFRQEKNIGGILNYEFVLNKAETKYFVFATADDLWSETFLSKNIMILNDDSSIVGSIGEIKWVGHNMTDIKKPKTKNSFFMSFYQKIQSRYGRYGSFSIFDNTYEKRAIQYLKKLISHDPSNILYSIFRTEELQKCITPKIFVGQFYSSFWNNVCLNILEYGNIHLSKDNQIFYYDGGSGAEVTPIIQYMRKQITLKQCIIPWGSQISWCVHKFGMKFFFKHFFTFLQLFIQGEITFVYSIFKYLKN